MGLLAGAGPSGRELEISLFGPGKGEGLAIHLGHGDWGIVDSCREQPGGAPATIAYLKAIGVDTERVSFVFATHWHDDHVQGLAETLANCPGAEFGCSAAYTTGEFEALVSEYPSNIRSAPIQEMLECFRAIESREPHGSVHHTPTRIAERATVWSSSDGHVTVTALAPTPQAIDRAQRNMAADLIPLAKKRRTGGAMTPNHGSVVLSIDLTSTAILLGGDLEERGSGGTGWSSVVTRLLPTYRRATVFKVPHHGSAGAHQDEQWTTLLEQTPISILTSYAQSDLPRRTDLARILRLSRDVYLGGGRHRLAPGLSRAEREAMAADGVELESEGDLGHIRLRTQLDDPGDWTVELSSGAVRVTDDLVGPSPSVSKKQRRSGRRR